MIKPTTREGKIKFLRDIYGGYTGSLAEAIVDRTGNTPSFDEYWDSSNIQELFGRGFGRLVGQLSNWLNPNSLRPPSASQISQELGQKKELVINEAKSMKRGLDKYKDYLSPDERNAFDSLLKTAYQWYPELKNEVPLYDVNSKSNFDPISVVTGEGSVQQQLNPQEKKTTTPEPQVTTTAQTKYALDQPGAEGQVINPAQPAQTATNLDPRVENLVDQALLTYKTNQNLQQVPGWSTSPYKQEAFARIQDIFSSADKLAEYVKSKNITDLKQFSWWNDSPYKQDAFNKIQQLNQANPGASTSTNQTEATTGGASTSNAGASSTADVTAGTQDALSSLENNAQFQALPDSLKSLFRDVVKNWDYNKELNVDNILKEFNRIKTETIDPHFAKEVEKFTNEVNTAYSFMKSERESELETERLMAGENVRQAKEGLEKSGMTFTGKGIETLGKDSAFAQPGNENNAIPEQTPFGGMFYEGTVNQANRVLSSSSGLRYQKQLESLGQSAENVLGGDRATNIVDGYGANGKLPGSIEETKQQQLSNVLTQLAGQNRQNMDQGQNINYNFPSFTL